MRGRKGVEDCQKTNVRRQNDKGTGFQTEGRCRGVRRRGRIVSPHHLFPVPCGGPGGRRRDRELVGPERQEPKRLFDPGGPRSVSAEQYKDSGGGKNDDGGLGQPDTSRCGSEAEGGRGVGRGGGWDPVSRPRLKVDSGSSNSPLRSHPPPTPLPPRQRLLGK